MALEFVFDLETSGLPKRKHFYDDVRIVTIAWILIDAKDKNIISQEYYVIKPDGFDIPEDSILIHGITNEFAKTHGVEISIMFERLYKAIKSCQTIISYNINFDYNVLKSSLIYYEQFDLLEEIMKKTQVCAMLMAQVHMQSPFYPKLSEAYHYVLRKKITDAHNALGDTISCYKLYKALA